jgi:tetratricopeptide (TPR) repeat protein
LQPIWGIRNACVPAGGALTAHTKHVQHGTQLPDDFRPTCNPPGLQTPNRLGRHEDAEPHYREALAARAAALGPDDPEVASTAHNLGACLGNLGQHAEALAFHKQALHGRERAALAAAGAADTAERAGDGAARERWARLRAQREAEALASHRAAAACLRRLGCGAQAEPHLRALLDAARVAAAAAAGPAPAAGDGVGSGGGAAGGGARRRRDALVELAAAAEDLGACLTAEGRHGDAEDAWWEALEARREALGERHPSVAELEGRLRVCLEALSAGGAG